MTGLLAVVWVLAALPFVFSFWVFGLAAMRMISGHSPRPGALARAGHCARNRPDARSARSCRSWQGTPGSRGRREQHANGRKP